MSEPLCKLCRLPRQHNVHQPIPGPGVKVPSHNFVPDDGIERCLVTGNPCGTDTRAVGHPCGCICCRLFEVMEPSSGEPEPIRKAGFNPPPRAPRPRFPPPEGRNAVVVRGGRTPEQEALRQRSGAVDSDDPLVTFLYFLMRDEVPSGVVERIAKEATGSADASFTNGWLAQHASDVASRLRAVRRS